MRRAFASDAIPLAKTDRGIPVGKEVKGIIDRSFEGQEILEFITMRNMKIQEKQQYHENEKQPWT